MDTLFNWHVGVTDVSLINHNSTDIHSSTDIPSQLDFIRFLLLD